jgi:hypothetical protein
VLRRNTYRSLVGNSEGRRLLGRQRHRWVDNIKMDLGEIVSNGVDWIGLAQDRKVESSCECGSEF